MWDQRSIARSTMYELNEGILRKSQCRVILLRQAYSLSKNQKGRFLIMNQRKLCAFRTWENEVLNDEEGNQVQSNSQCIVRISQALNQFLFYSLIPKFNQNQLKFSSILQQSKPNQTVLQ